jgi:hypothetical protein
MDKSKITEISSDFIAEAEGAQYYLRIVETGDGSARQPRKRKFGVSRYWYCEQVRNWLPAKKGHVYLPVDLWNPFQQALARTQPRVVSDGNGHSVAIGCGGENSPAAADSAACAASAITSSVGEKQPADANTATDVAAKRKRGRPPKCRQPVDTARHGRHECSAEESGPDSGEGDETTQRGANAAENFARDQAAKSKQVATDASGGVNIGGDTVCTTTD